MIYLSKFNKDLVIYRKAKTDNLSVKFNDLKDRIIDLEAAGTEIRTNIIDSYHHSGEIN